MDGSLKARELIDAAYENGRIDVLYRGWVIEEILKYNLMPYLISNLAWKPTEAFYVAFRLFSEDLKSIVLKHPLVQASVVKLNCEDDVVALTEKYAGQTEPVVVMPLFLNQPLEVMLRNGLVPLSLRSRENLIDAEETYFALKDYSFEDKVFWSMSGRVDLWQGDVVWYYFPIDYVRKQAIVKGNGFLLSKMIPSLVYSSFRPKTDMSLYRVPSSLKEVDEKEWKTIPVTRYSEGMSRGKYHGDKEEGCNYCGTFYYYEPESTTKLAYRTAYRSFNKVTAYEELSGYQEKIDSILGLWSDQKLPLDLKLTKSQVNGLSEGDLPEDIEVYEDEVKEYAGNVLGLYAMEDDYDQKLCLLAASKGYDIVILESMIGSFQVVTEVLDTRDRIESFRSLIYTE